MLAEEAFEDRVEDLKIARVIEPHSAANHMLRPITRFSEDGEQIANRLFGLSSDPACDKLSIQQRDLPRHVQPACGFYRSGKGQMLPSRALASLCSVPPNAHARYSPRSLIERNWLRREVEIAPLDLRSLFPPSKRMPVCQSIEHYPLLDPQASPQVESSGLGVLL